MDSGSMGGQPDPIAVRSLREFCPDCRHFDDNWAMLEVKITPISNIMIVLKVALS